MTLKEILKDWKREDVHPDLVDYAWKIDGHNKFCYSGKQTLPVVFIDREGIYGKDYWQILFHTKRKSWTLNHRSDHVDEAMQLAEHWLPNIMEGKFYVKENMVPES